MKKNLVKLLALVLVVVLMASLFIGCKPKDEPQPEKEYTGADTLVVGYSYFSEKFSPFFATTAYDQDVATMVSIGLLGMDREGNVVEKGKTGAVIPYNGTDYTYRGIADVTVTKNDDGTVVYDFDMRDDIKFSDGEPLTADDVIFSIYVLSDPTYDGASSFYAQPIKGMKEYRAGMQSLGSLIVSDGREATSEFYTAEQAAAYWAAIDATAEPFLQDILTYCTDYGATTIGEACSLWGYDMPADATATQCIDAMLANYGGDVVTMAATEAGGAYDMPAEMNAILGDAAADYTKGVQISEGAANISGVEKTGDYSLKITMNEFDATAIYNLGVTIAPLHYYGDKAAFNYAENQFGFTKGDLTGVKAKTTQPLGAGPYKFVSYENGAVSFERNENYFLGVPKIKNIVFQETADGDKMTGVASGTFDITDPSFDTTAVDGIKGYNSNGELTGDIITTTTVDNLGYGYIGLNADTMRVGNESGSEASKNLRRAFATLYAVHRDTVINSYYGERASVINYPISNTSWAAPKPADEGYRLAYSTDVDGKDIYTEGMTEDEKCEAALQAAIGFLKAAGYTWDDASKKFTAAPDGAALTYEVIIPADGVGDHPVYGVLTDVQSQLETIGITLAINDPADSNVLWDSLDAGTQNMWAAAWGATPDPDMYQVYHSNNIVGKDGTNSNHYHIADETLDTLIMEARTSADQAFRKDTYKQCLELIMEWAVEVPTYQRQNAFIFSTERVNMETVTPDITTFWTWLNDLELLEMN